MIVIVLQQEIGHNGDGLYIRNSCRDCYYPYSNLGAKMKTKNKDELEVKLTMSIEEATWLCALMAKPIKKFDCEYSDEMRKEFSKTLKKALKD